MDFSGTALCKPPVVPCKHASDMARCIGIVLQVDMWGRFALGRGHPPIVLVIMPFRAHNQPICTACHLGALNSFILFYFIILYPCFGPCRVARHAGLIRTWAGLSSMIQEPLAAAVTVYNRELPEELKPPTDMQKWRQQKQEQRNSHDVQVMAVLLRKQSQIAKQWVHGVLAWIGQEIAAAAPKKVSTRGLLSIEEGSRVYLVVVFLG